MGKYLVRRTGILSAEIMNVNNASQDVINKWLKLGYVPISALSEKRALEKATGLRLGKYRKSFNSRSTKRRGKSRMKKKKKK